jgi:hypothetical protein
MSNKVKDINPIKTMSNYDLFEIGRPCKFPEQIDPFLRTSKYLKSKMNVVDILPCEYFIDLTENARDEINNISALIPKVFYDEPIKRYTDTCQEYYLDAVKGVRIYTTDDTTYSESISTSYKDNFFQDTANKASSMLENMKTFGSSVHSSSGEALSNKSSDLLSKGKKWADEQGANGSFTGMASSTLGLLADTVIAGKKVSFPSIWQDTNYQQQMSLQVKLVSPYGHPKSIKEFIIRPLMHLLLLVSPFTDDGISYGKPPALTIKGYGTGGTRLGGIQNITINRGGQNTTFTVYKQPLVIDINIQFGFLINGFGIYKKTRPDSSIPQNHKNLINNADLIKADRLSYQSGTGSTILNGMPEVIETLFPINIDNYAHEESASDLKPDELKFDKFDFGKNIDNEFSNFGAKIDKVEDSVKKTKSVTEDIFESAMSDF